MAADGVHLAHGSDHAVGHQPQHAVAEGVAVAVVELLEVVQVHEQQREPGAVAPGAGDGLREAVEQRGAVGQPRQRVQHRGLRGVVQRLPQRPRPRPGWQRRQHQLLVDLDEPRRLALRPARLSACTTSCSRRTSSACMASTCTPSRASLPSASATGGSVGRGVGFTGSVRSAALRHRRRRPPAAAGRARLAGRPPAEQAFLVGQHLAHADAVVADAVQAQLVGMRARAHLDHGHHALQPAVDLDVALHDDRVGQEGRAVGAEAQVGVAVFQLGGHQHRHAGARQRRHQPEQRLAEVGAEGRRQRELEAAERIEHDAGAPSAAAPRSGSAARSRRSTGRAPGCRSGPPGRARSGRRARGLRARLGCCSKAATTPVSPQRAPSARKDAARMLLPDPEGPATSSE